MVRKKAEGPVTAALFDVDGTLVGGQEPALACLNKSPEYQRMRDLLRVRRSGRRPGDMGDLRGHFDHGQLRLFFSSGDSSEARPLNDAKPESS
jgi:hypothetical protein